MQQRYRVASTNTFEEAIKVKSVLVEKFPDKVFQIRKSHKGFNVVERRPASEVTENRVPSPPKYKRRRNRVPTF